MTAFLDFLVDGIMALLGYTVVIGVTLVPICLIAVIPISILDNHPKEKQKDDRKGISKPLKYILIASGVILLLFATCVLYWHFHRDANILKIISESVWGLLGSFFGGVIVWAVFYGIVSFFLKSLERFLSKYVELKSSFAESFKSSLISVYVGIFVGFCLIAGVVQ